MSALATLEAPTAALPVPATLPLSTLLSLPPQCWRLTETPPKPGEIMPHMNILARKNFSLVNPDDDRQALYCYCDQHVKAGKRVWEKRYAGSTQANRALFQAWVPRDGWSDAAGTKEDLVATCARIFREANARKKRDR